MKQKTFIIAAMLAFTGLSSSNATVITVSNNINTPGQYTGLQAAIDAASPGDTIYVHGSGTSYGNITIDKRLTLLGTGHNPDKDSPFISQVGTIYLDSIFAVSGASGSKIIGFDASGISVQSDDIHDITIKRNNFNSVSFGTYSGISDFIIINNIISSPFDVRDNTNIIISNNIINSYIRNSDQPSVLITNNVFQANSTASGVTAFEYVVFATIANNIFIGRTPYHSTNDNNIFTNNIAYQTYDNVLPYGTNTGSGNIVFDPMFVNVTGSSFSYSLDYHLQGGSPGINAGTDGTDIGIYGGTTPWGDMTGSPAIPQMKIFNINNSVLPLNDSLNIYFKAKKQD